MSADRRSKAPSNWGCTRLAHRHLVLPTALKTPNLRTHPGSSEHLHDETFVIFI